MPNHRLNQTPIHVHSLRGESGIRTHEGVTPAPFPAALPKPPASPIPSTPGDTRGVEPFEGKDLILLYFATVVALTGRLTLLGTAEERAQHTWAWWAAFIVLWPAALPTAVWVRWRERRAERT